MACIGTLEIGGLTSGQALEIVRGCRGLNIVGCDLVEVRNDRWVVRVILVCKLNLCIVCC